MARLIIVRHGESVWNMENRFTGWIDVDLSQKGIAEAQKAGELLRDYRFDKIYVSHLIRAIHTMQLILEKTSDKRTPMIFHEDDSEEKKREHHTGDESKELPIFMSKKIAERYYGNLQGLNKDDARAKWGAEQVQIWRRSFNIPPPAGESLKDTMSRVMPYWDSTIKKDLISGKTILIVAHGNSLRAIIKYLEKISDEDIPNHEIPTGVPIEYELDNELNVVSKKELV